MPTNTRVDDLKINKLTVSQYRNAVANHTIGENEISVLTDAIIIQTDTMPIASAEYDGKIVQYTGITSSPYVCGYFYICTGSSDVYSWNQINVQPEKDAHNLGYYSTPEDLALAHPTATAGDYAIVNSTDTVWIWDTDTSSWKDGDTQGQVTSVNNQTGDVVLTASDLGAQEELVSQVNIKSIDGNSLLGSGNLELSTYLPFPNSWTTNSTTKAFCDDVAADTSAVAGKAYLGEVVFSDLNTVGLVNAEIVVEIMAGSTAATKVIVLRMTSGNHAPYQWQYTYWNGGSDVSGWVGFQPELPSQSGQSGKFLTTNGSSLSWGTVDALPSQTSHSGEFLTTDGTDANWSPLATVATTGSYNDLEDQPDIPTEARQVGAIPELGSMPTADAEYENLIVQYAGTTTSTYTNGYFYRCDSTFVSAASATISQTVGSTLSDLAIVAADFESFYPETGIYDFVFDGVDWYYNEDVVDLTSLGITFSGTPDMDDTIEVDFTATEYSYAWNRVDVQPGGSSYTAGTGIDITGGVISVTAPTLTNRATGQYSLAIGDNSAATASSNAVAINGRLTNANGVVIGASNNQDCIIIGSVLSNSTGRNTIVLNSTSDNISYADLGSGEQSAFYVKTNTVTGAVKLMSADGTIPSDRLVHAINKYSTIPTASANNLGWIVQFTGTTDSTYTHGHLYECVSDGQTPATYSWTEVQLGGGSSLPSQGGHSGEFLTTDGTDASWGSPIVATFKVWGANE